MKLNQKGFTLIEILAAVTIVGILMVLGIPAISRTIEESRKSAYLDAVLIQKSSIEKLINSDDYYVFDPETVYYFDYRLVNEEEAMRSPWNEWSDAYVVVTYDGKNNHFYWTGVDKTGWRIDLVQNKEVEDLTTRDIYLSNNTTLTAGKTIGGRDRVVVVSLNTETGEIDEDDRDISYEVTMEEITKCFTIEQFTDGSYAIIDYDVAKCGKEVEVPSHVDGIPVTIIGENAFRGKGLTKVTLYNGIKELQNGAFQNNAITELKLSSSITTIGPFAFYQNKLATLDLPEGLVEISTYGFANNQLTEVHFPKTLTKIGSYAFYGNKLKDIDFQSNITSLGGGAFSNNKMPASKGIIYRYDATKGQTDYSYIVGYAGESKDVVIPEYVNGVQLKTIGPSAFASNGLKSVVIPDSVTRIEGSAFYSNYLTEVTLPSNLTFIGGSAFRSNFLSSIDIPDSVTSNNNAFISNCFPEGEDIIYKKNADGTWDYSYIVSGAGGRVNNNYNCHGATTLKIPAEKNGVKLKTIAGSAFSCCYYTKIEMPNLADTDHLTVGVNAFYHNSVPVADGWFYRIENGAYNYEILTSYGGLRGGNAASGGSVLSIPGEKNGVKLKGIIASFTWVSYSTIVIPESVEYLPDAKSPYTLNSKSRIFSKSNTNNTKLVKIVNLTGKEFDWYYLTESNHPSPGKFRVGVVSHQSGDIEITDHL